MASVKVLNLKAVKNTQSILGMSWEASLDCFQFVCSLSNENVSKLTRCVVVSLYSRIIDPLGFIQPFILHPKLLIQELSCLKIGWDDVVSELN